MSTVGDLERSTFNKAAPPNYGRQSYKMATSVFTASWIDTGRLHHVLTVSAMSRKLAYLACPEDVPLFS
jgi:hypothetical protein